MRTDELDFHLPPELIAQEPAAERSASRLLHYRRSDRSVAHRRFSDLPSLLRAGDLLVFNNAQVLPARFMLLKSTGGKVEGLFLNELRPGRWRVLLRNLGRFAGPLRFAAAPEVVATPAAAGRAADEKGGLSPLLDSNEKGGPSPLLDFGGGEYEIDVGWPGSARSLLERVGRAPLPPYIERRRDGDARDEADRRRYQTVYARSPGAVAAPTAGLHFTDQLLAALGAAGVESAFVTLHVGMGTFKPVTADTLEAHPMHEEAYSIERPAADAVNLAAAGGRRIVAVGTTAARVLESQEEGRPVAPREASTRIFIHPPYRWRRVGALITNFHLPRSTLIALVAALTGLDEQRRIYRAAIAERYRFYSYGDAMLIE